MKTEAHSAAWTSIGWIGSALFLLTWVEVALPEARRLLGSILPWQMFATLLIATGLCIAAGILKKRWFLLPGVCRPSFDCAVSVGSLFSTLLALDAVPSSNFALTYYGDPGRVPVCLLRFGA